MRRLSSSATLALKIFFPTFWIVFFGLFTVAVLLSGMGKAPLLGSIYFKVGALIFYLLGVTLLYLTVMQLKRVEIDDEFVYVTNYFKNYRYPYQDIEKITEQDYLLFKTARLTLVNRGSLGRRITFLQSKQKFEDFVKSYPKLASKLEPSS